MKKILLVCVAGMSTSLLVSKMQKAAKEKNFEVEIQASPVNEASELIDKSDLTLLGPQVKYMLKKLKKEHPSSLIEPIDMQLYGMVDGLGVLKKALERMEA